MKSLSPIWTPQDIMSLEKNSQAILEREGIKFSEEGQVLLKEIWPQ